MKCVDTIARIRREFFAAGKTIKQIVRELHVSCNTVRKVVRTRGRMDAKYASMKDSGQPFSWQSIERRDATALFGDHDRRSLLAVREHLGVTQSLSIVSRETEEEPEREWYSLLDLLTLKDQERKEMEDRNGEKQSPAVTEPKNAALDYAQRAYLRA